MLGYDCAMSLPTENTSDYKMAELPVIGELTARDYARARKCGGFSIWTNWREFREERDAQYFGLSLAGVTAIRQIVPLEAFERWTRLTGASCDVPGLDEFAAHWRWRSAHTSAPIVGCFRSVAEEVREIAVQGAQRVPIRAELFRRWSDDFVRLDLFPAQKLDDYATHAISCCMTSRG